MRYRLPACAAQRRPILPECVALTRVIGAIDTMRAELMAEVKMIHATLSDNTQAIQTQNGRVRVLEERRWRLDASLSTLGKVGAVAITAVGLGIAIAKLFL